MNNTFSQQALKASVLLTSLSVAVLSTKLTYDFLNSYSQTLGFVGITLEASKFLFPLLAVIAYRQSQHWKSLLFGVLAVLLSTISFFGSYAALEDGIGSDAQKVNQQSEMYSALTFRIDSLKTQASELKLSADELASNRITDKKNLKSQAADLEKQAFDLMTERANLTATDTVATHSNTVITTVSLAVEFANFSLALALGLLTVKNTVPNTLDTSVITLDEPSYDEDFAEELDPVDNTVVFTLKNTDQDIKTAIVQKRVEPSHRGISKRFKGVHRDTVNRILLELLSCGVLEPYRNGYRLAKV